LPLHSIIFDGCRISDVDRLLMPRRSDGDWWGMIVRRGFDDGRALPPAGKVSGTATQR
jgi:hypothetical protein